MSQENETHGRQYGTSLSEIEFSHRARYQWAASILGSNDSVIVDIGCGVGYGSWILANSGKYVYGVDQSELAIRIALETWNKSCNSPSDVGATLFVNKPADEFLYEFSGSFDHIICFEMIEHMPFKDAQHFAGRMRDACDSIFISTPNQIVYPFNSENPPKGHFYHMTPSELDAMMHPFVRKEFGSHNKGEPVDHGHFDKRFLVARYVREGN